MAKHSTDGIDAELGSASASYLLEGIMGRMIKQPGLDHAEAILHLAQLMMDDDDFDISVAGVSGNKTTGLHFTMGHGFPTRKASVLNHPVTDGFIIVYGEYPDFQPNNNANDSASRVAFDFDQHAVGARALLDYLYKGHPVRGGQIE
jgi:hypothetical protein